ncbi:MAG: DUF2442 domain-containing protein [Parvularculaceae bacterium]
MKCLEVKALDGAQLWLRFSDGSEGVRDMSDILAEGGPMVEALREPKMFGRVFLECGAPTWPNGFDLDAINLQMELAAAGKLKRPALAI